MTVVVTGASGHIGTNLVNELLRRGRRVRVLIHERERSLAGLDVERARGDVRRPASLRAAFEGADVLYHLAAIISLDGSRGGLVQQVNVEGVANVAQTALECGVRRMVHFSSIHAFSQDPLDRPLDETRPKVSGPNHAAYDRSKAAGEARLGAAIERGLDAVIVNPSGVIGPNDDEPSRMGRMFLSYVRRRIPTLVPGGFDWVDVRDVVSSAIAAEERGRTGENYLLSGHWQSAADIMRMFGQVSGVPTPRVMVPLWLAQLGAPVMQLWGRLVGEEPLYTIEALRALQANRDIRHDKAARELGHHPRPTLETVQAIYDSFVASGVIRRAA